jgi:hypothetical protein
MFVSPLKIRLLFLAKAIVVPPTFLALLVWAFVRVPLDSSLLAPKGVLSGNERSWAWLGAFNSAIGFFATAGVNMPDFTVSTFGPLQSPPIRDNMFQRYAKNERACVMFFRNDVPLQTNGVISQSIHPARSNPYWFYVSQLHRSRSHKCWRRPLWPSSLGPAQAYRPVGQSRLRILHISRVRSLHARLEYLSEFSGCWERYGCAVPPIHQHSTWADHMRDSRRLGALSMEDSRQVRICSWEISAQLTGTGSAPGFLSFVSSYTVFAGPIIGIIVTDVYTLFPRVISTVLA